MSETKIVRRTNPSLVVSSTDPHRISGTPTDPKQARPRTIQHNVQQAGVQFVGAPRQHDMRRSGPESLGKGAPVTPSPMKASEAGEAAQAIARKGPTQADLANAREIEELRAENARLTGRLQASDARAHGNANDGGGDERELPDLEGGATKDKAEQAEAPAAGAPGPSISGHSGGHDPHRATGR